MGNANLHYREPLLHIPERNGPQIPQQRFNGVLWVADGMVYWDNLLLYLQCK